MRVRVRVRMRVRVRTRDRTRVRTRVRVHLGEDLWVDHGPDHGPHCVEHERRVDEVHGAHELGVGVVELRDVRLQQPEEGAAGVLHVQPGQVEDDDHLVHTPAARV
jgi:hypothetical protein